VRRANENFPFFTHSLYTRANKRKAHDAAVVEI